MRETIALLAALAASLLVAAGAGAWLLLHTPAASGVATAAPPAPEAHGSSVTNSLKTAPAQAPTTPPEPVRPAAEPLPPVPRADAKSKLTALLPDDTLYLETLPDGKKRVLAVAEVCVSKPPDAEVDPLLEVFLCKKGTKEHEAILRVSMDARYIHAALEAAGTAKGSPVQFINPKTGEEDYKAATGGVVKVLVHYRKDGKLHTHPAQDWIRDKKTNKPMAHDWVFAGSRFAKNPDAPPGTPDYYCANNGEVIAVSNFPDSMLDLPIKVSQDNSELNFEADMKKVPPVLSKVWVILEPTGAKK